MTLFLNKLELMPFCSYWNAWGNILRGNGMCWGDNFLIVSKTEQRRILISEWLWRRVSETGTSEFSFSVWTRHSGYASLESTQLKQPLPTENSQLTTPTTYATHTALHSGIIWTMGLFRAYHLPVVTSTSLLLWATQFWTWKSLSSYFQLRI